MNGYDTVAKLGCAGGCGCDDCNHEQLGSYGKQIEWNTEPVINNYTWNRDGYWDCNDWMTWHKKVAAKYGVPRANEVFMIWWNKQGNFAYGNDCTLLNQTFRNYFKSVGLTLDTIGNFITKPFDVVQDVQEGAANVIKSGVDTAENVAAGAASTGKTLSWIVPTAIVLLVGGLGYYGYKHYIKGNEKIKKPTLI